MLQRGLVDALDGVQHGRRAAHVGVSLPAHVQFLGVLRVIVKR